MLICSLCYADWWFLVNQLEWEVPPCQAYESEIGNINGAPAGIRTPNQQIMSLAKRVFVRSALYRPLLIS